MARDVDASTIGIMGHGQRLDAEGKFAPRVRRSEKRKNTTQKLTILAGIISCITMLTQAAVLSGFSKLAGSDANHVKASIALREKFHGSDNAETNVRKDVSSPTQPKEAVATQPTAKAKSNETENEADALDADGKRGYVADLSPSRLSTFVWDKKDDYPCDDTAVEGPEGRTVLEKIRSGLKDSREKIKQRSGDEKVPKILCMVYTVDLPKARKNMEAVVSTWAKECDGFIAASNITDDTIGAVNILHPGPEIYNNMWLKVRSMWMYAYSHYLDDYDYFHICGDDVYLMMDNFRSYLMGEEMRKLLKEGYIDALMKTQLRRIPEISTTAQQQPRPLLLGHPRAFRGLFPYGGPGYTLNREAVKRLNEQLFNDPEDGINSVQESREDVYMFYACRKLGWSIADSRDSEGAWRYMEHDAQHMFHYNVKPLEKLLGPGTHKDGINEVSKETVAGHLKLDRAMKRRKYLPPPGIDSYDMLFRYHEILDGRCTGES